MEKDFTALLTQHKALLYKVCYLYASTDLARHDLFQDIVLQLWRAHPQYNTSYKWTTWAYRIALNVAITQQRRQKEITVPLEHIAQQIPDIPYNATVDDQTTALYQAISQLNAAEKALILLYLDDRSYEEMARILGISDNNVGVKLNRVKTKLKLIISNGKS